MATSEEKKDLVEELKGPHYYRIQLWGYGGEASYMRISKEAYEFWNEALEEGDSAAVSYVVSAEEYTADEVNNNEDLDGLEIPKEAMFMHDVDDAEAVGYTWYEPKDEIEHVWGVAADSARVTIDKVESDEYNAKWIEDVIEGEDLYELINRVGEETDYEVELSDCLTEDINRPAKGDYVCQFYSSEKGTFFEGLLVTPGLIDINKLKFIIDEAPNGEDTVWSVLYDGEEIDNNGGDTNGKGYYASVWEQEW